MQIGYTNDGKVFLTETCKSTNGQPAQTTLTWEPAQAMRVAELINIAAEKANAIESSGGHG